MNICDFSRSEGAGRATSRKMRGLTRSVRALIVPPLPAASRPSKMTITRSPFSLIQSCSVHNSIWSLRSAFSYFLRFIGSGVASIGLLSTCGLHPAAPAVLPSHAAEHEVVADARVDPFAAVELDRISPVHGQRQGQSRAPVPLEIVPRNTVDGRAPPGVVGGVQCRPRSARPHIDDVTLRRVDRVLRAMLSPEEIVVVRVEVH